MRNIVIWLGAAALLLSGCAQAYKTEQITATPEGMKGSVTLTKADGVKVHTYMAPVKFAGNTSHIIESDNGLMIVDAQMVVPFAKEVRAYADSLGKPIERLIISHGHPDHWLGLDAGFADIPAYTLAKTQGFLAKKGDMIRQQRQAKMGKMIASSFSAPQEIIKLGEAKLDGVNYIFERVVSAEADEQLIIKLPEQKIIIVQDLVYTDVHLFIGQNHLNDWIAYLKKLQKEDYDIVLAGHGLPTDKAIYEKNIEYLTFAQAAIESSSTPDVLKAKLLARFPNKGFQSAIDISSSYLYGKGH